MTLSPMAQQLRTGMRVISSDGLRVGKVTNILFSDTAYYLEVWQQQGLGMGVDTGNTVYIPSAAIATVSRRWLRRVVMLHADAATVTTWTRKPKGFGGDWEPRPSDPGIGHWN